jgi:hypothetical protein
MLSYQPDLHAGKDADISIAANLCAWDDRRVNIAQCKNAITGRADIATQAAQHGSAMTTIDWARLLRCTECDVRDADFDLTGER